ncbi:hypothetical protein Cylst_6641 (plasmid) [Cylindrospermum stagnale PCC 7417]|uniref:Uncharacterized protein n=1 Tax=Cylindrospermum stagnale PCC 7417 TaxID=56107 RepID=K9X7D6_9NOST|nr:hypothetical protein [Cylindrospermum stagnale]AFZ28408.1 hypothetical protein Cylst_6641 [Cylindrospermum stagnale PCC 7417]
MNIEFKELVARSGDSQLVEYQFSNGLLTIHMEIDDLDESVIINVSTQLVYGEKIPSDYDILKTCRLELVELNSILNIEHEFYVPNFNFGKMMKEVNCGASLAYGRKCSDAKWLLNVIGYSRLISCIISNLEEVSWQVNANYDV